MEGVEANWNLVHITTKEQILITKSPFHVGRAENMDIICRSINVSRSHADVLVYIDGSLHIKANKSLNGTYINRRPIRKDEIASVNDGDEIGFGSHSGMLLEDINSLYIYIAKRRVLDKIEQVNVCNGGQQLEISSQPDVFKENKVPLINSTSNCVALPPVVTTENSYGTSTSSNIDKSNKPDNVVAISLPGGSKNSNVETNNAPGYLVDENGCIVIDSDTDDVIIKKEPFSSSMNDSMFNDTIFCNMKKELEGLDKYEDNFMPTYCIDSDGEASQDWDDIFNLSECEKSPIGNENNNIKATNIPECQKSPLENEDNNIKATNIPECEESPLENEDNNIKVTNIHDCEKSPLENEANNIKVTNIHECEKLPIENEDNNRKVTNIPEGKKSALENEDNNIKVTNIPDSTNRSTNNTNIHLQNIRNRMREKVSDKIPPIIPPHFEKNLEKNNKRKSPLNKTSNTEQMKKIKTNNFYDSKLKQDCKKTTCGAAENIEIRKRKLKEIAEKSQNEQMKRKSSRSNTAKVKVSDGRGKFLETPCDAPSTSKIRVITVKPLKKFSISANQKVSNNISNRNETITTCKIIEPKPLTTVNNIPAMSNNAPLLPVSHIKRINHQKNGYREGEHALLIKDVEDIILEMLTWDVAWFSDRNYNDKVPNLRNHPLQRMNKSFTSYAEYYNIVMPLLMVEVWNFLYKEVDFNFTNEPIIYFTIQKESVRRTFIELDCLTHLPNDKNFKEGDVIVLQLYLENQNNDTKPPKIAVLGYVVSVNKKTLVDRETPSTSKNAVTQMTIVNARIMIQHLKGVLNKTNNVRPFFQYITSFTSSARTIRSIKYLEKSALCQHILRPSVSLYEVPSAPKSQIYLKDRLNKEQLEAVSEATDLCLNNIPRIYLIHGPPGTGKTTVIINIILSVIFDAKFKDKCILVTAPTNAAVDELAVRIIAAKTQLKDNYRKMVDMVRIGPKNSIRAEVQDYSLYESAKRTLWRDLIKHESIENRRKLKEMKDKMDFWRYQKDQPNAKVKCKSASVEFEEFCKEILGRSYNDRIGEFENVLLKGARIICTTLSSCASIKMERVFTRLPGKISCCIVDEATQSTEQETLIPLILGIDKLILVGDPKQLPALSFAQESKTYGLGQSLFSRIEVNFRGVPNNPIKFLNTQYRMHPAVCSFPNKEFYDGKLKNAAALFNRKSPLNALRPYLVFHFQGDTDNTEEYRNKSEILCVILLLEAIVSKVPDTCNFSIGIITPYNDQKQGILQNINKKTFRSNVLITVNTVDSFQGRENDIIIMSCVRCHANSFLSDDQRLNVALTRAKFALYIIGSTNLFMSCLKFGKIRKDADSRKLLKNLDTRMPMSALNRMIFM